MWSDKPWILEVTTLVYSESENVPFLAVSREKKNGFLLYMIGDRIGLGLV